MQLWPVYGLYSLCSYGLNCIEAILHRLYNLLYKFGTPYVSYYIQAIFIVMAYIVMAYIVMAYIVVAHLSAQSNAGLKFG